MQKLLLLIFGFSICYLLLVDSALAADWSQDAGNAQRTGSTPEDPVEPWTFKWTWNGPDANGGTGNHFYDAPKEARSVTGGSSVYVPAGSQGLYALSKADGSQVWHVSTTAFNAAPAYDNGFVYTGGADGNLYKINALTGQFQTYSVNSPINKATLVVTDFVYVVSDDGRLHKINSTTLASTWVYSSGSPVATPPSYSPSRDIIIFATDDLNVHAVNNSTGAQKWKVKPTPNTPGFPNEFELAWPVIAEQHGLVFLRMRLPHNYMFDYPSSGGIFPNSLSTARDYLNTNPNHQNLFALNLDTGSKEFTPAVGYGSTEDYINGGPYGAMGSQPAVKTWTNGDEVIYIHFRNGQSNPPDGRWDGHMGEMVLDTTTIPGLAPGDLRFMRTSRYNGYGGSGYDHIVDEETPITLAGNTIFNSHWAAVTSHTISNRSDSLGLSYSSPIETTKHPSIIRALSDSCTNKNTSTHWTTCTNLNYVTDGATNPGRYFSGPGWWIYWGVADPPGWRVGSGNTAGTSYSSGFQPRYTYVSDKLIVVEGNGGDLTVFQHSGSTSATPTQAPTAIPPTPTTTPPFSLTGLISSWHTSAAQYDLNSDGTVNSLDFALAVIQFFQPTPTPLPASSTWFEIGKGFTDVTPHQIVRTNTDRVYVFANQAEGSNILHAYWSTNSLPTSSTDFSGTTVNTGSAAIQIDTAYDGTNTIHVLAYLQNGNLLDYPFDTSSNTFRPPLALSSGNPTITGNYLGSGGVSSMFDSTGNLHIAYWAATNQIKYNSYTYNQAANQLSPTASDERIDAFGSANHPHLAVSPLDNSVTVAWVSEATAPQKILARTKPTGGTWETIQSVSTTDIWTSTNSGINIDQGPNMVIDSSGTRHLVYIGDFGSCGTDYGRVHYVTSATGTIWTDITLDTCTHDPALALRSNGDLYLLGHGYPTNTTCTNMQDMCTKLKPAGASWQATQVFAVRQTAGHFDASPSVRWSVVGWNRPDTIEFIFFRANNGSYQDTQIMYGRL